jgi:hypothetical protein
MTNLLIAAAVLIFILVRQLRTQPVRGRSRLALILAAIGVVQTVEFVGKHSLDVSDLVFLARSLVVGLGIAGVRSYTVKLWVADGVLLRRGTWLTALLWLVGVGQHLLIDRFVSPGFGDASLLVYFGLMIGAQHVVLMARSRSVEGATKLGGWSSTNSPAGSRTR